MKADLPPRPDHPPKKRRALHDPNVTPNIWLHEWAADESLSAHERGRADEERRRRRDAEKKASGVVGLVAGAQGVTATQQRVIVDVVRGMLPGVAGVVAPSALAPWLWQRGSRPPRLRKALDELGVSVTVDSKLSAREVVLACTALIALPHERALPLGAERVSPMWVAARYGRHRKIPVTVIMPDGTTLMPDGILILPDGTKHPGGAWT